ncbi:hypothetical protein HNQ04_003801 [Deinococcus radiopugnans ATCC 19172]|uniref:Potassium-transporting ATPase subunit F n=1 Tax=Deinococcus radiopugnans ATCC 19172 TaxID=585398 RepID=A0ABR6NZA3_9DEIO|nr:hypothetical protein [Deinococcus radiopugnans]MBB6018520.1 hypothetical protein [Deinococcus radiopugnans ATCC 19172]
MRGYECLFAAAGAGFGRLPSLRPRPCGAVLMPGVLLGVLILLALFGVAAWALKLPDNL